MYNSPTVYLPSWNIWSVCAENVENVVNPPQKPTLATNSASFCKVAINRPIRKAPDRFAANVARTGETAICDAKTVSRYLAILPAKPPIPTNRQFLNTCVSIIIYTKIV